MQFIATALYLHGPSVKVPSWAGRGEYDRRRHATEIEGPARSPFSAKLSAAPRQGVVAGRKQSTNSTMENAHDE
jgi:hypothetical protein